MLPTVCFDFCIFGILSSYTDNKTLKIAIILLVHLKVKRSPIFFAYRDAISDQI